MHHIACLLAAALLVVGRGATALQQASGAAEAASLRPAMDVEVRDAQSWRLVRPAARSACGGSEGIAEPT